MSILRKIIFILPILSVVLEGSISMPVMFKDGMVLQRDEPVVIWGAAEANEEIAVKLGQFRGATTAESDGSWQVELGSISAGGPYELEITGNNDIVNIKDVYLGDVWVFSGQSNMQVSFEYFLNLDNIDEKYNSRFRKDVKNCGEDKLVRTYMAATKDFREEKIRNKAENNWVSVDPEYVIYCNPVAYYFAREVSEKTGVMTAAVRIAWGGHHIEKFYKGGYIYENMLKPWSKYKVKGVIWYQGENNLYKDGDRFAYALKLQLLIKDYRDLWQDPCLPFYIVQMPPADYASRSYNDETSLSVFLEAQRQVLAVPETYMAVASDLGMANGLHQPQKYELALRLANLAFANEYGYQDAIPAGPQFKDFRVQDNKIIVNFETFGSGLTTKDGQPPRFFEIMSAGKNKGFCPAEAEIKGNSVILWNKEIDKPYDVRFAFDQDCLMEINLVNSEGLPAAVFWARAPKQLHPGILSEMKSKVK